MAFKLLVIQCENRSRSDTTVIVLKENCTFNLSIEKETQETHYLGRSQLHSYFDVLSVKIKKKKILLLALTISILGCFKLSNAQCFFRGTIVRLYDCGNVQFFDVVISATGLQRLPRI